MSESLEHVAQGLFRELATEFAELRIVIDPNDPHVEVSAEIPRQPGLDFDVHLDLQNGDELHLVIDDVFWCSWFPCSDSMVVARYRDAVVGVLSGRNRIVEYRRRGRTVGADLQEPTEKGWKTVAISSSAFLPRRWWSSVRVLQNPSRRPAAGSS